MAFQRDRTTSRRGTHRGNRLTMQIRLQNTMSHPMNPKWMTTHPLRPIQSHYKFPVRSTNWLAVCTTFSAMTELRMQRSLGRSKQNNLTCRTLVSCSRQETWPTFPAIWQIRRRSCHSMLCSWRWMTCRKLRMASSRECWARWLIHLSLSLYFDVIAISCVREQIRASSPSVTPKKASRQRGVCVWNIWRDVKLLTRGFLLVFNLIFGDLISFLFQYQNRFSFSAGELEPICLSSPTKLWHFGGWVVWSTTCTCRSWHGCRGHSSFIFTDGIRLSLEPARRFSNNFSNVFHTKRLYGFRNLTELHQNLLNLRART